MQKIIKAWAINLWDEAYCMIDVRTPAEFEQGHVPGAVNVPLFSNEERAAVGTLYKQVGKFDAIEKGLNYVGPKLGSYLREVSQHAGRKQVIMYCWRGGMRSNSMAWLMETCGLSVCVLEGGYKAYRKWVLESFANIPMSFIILGGKTGIGKTKLLRMIQSLGEPVLDLEACAHHKGSAFGWIGEEKQGTNEQFENELHRKIIAMSQTSKYAWLENESRSIGSNFIPLDLWNHMKRSPLINISRDMQIRLDILVEHYHSNHVEDLVESFKKIEKRLGHEATAQAIEYVRNGMLREAALIALRYYDKCYEYNLEQNASPIIEYLDCEQMDEESIVRTIVSQKEKWYHGTTT